MARVNVNKFKAYSGTYEDNYLWMANTLASRDLNKLTEDKIKLTKQDMFIGADATGAAGGMPNVQRLASEGNVSGAHSMQAGAQYFEVTSPRGSRFARVEADSLYADRTVSDARMKSLYEAAKARRSEVVRRRQTPGSRQLMANYGRGGA